MSGQRGGPDDLDELGDLADAVSAFDEMADAFSKADKALDGKLGKKAYTGSATGGRIEKPIDSGRLERAGGSGSSGRVEKAGAAPTAGSGRMPSVAPGGELPQLGDAVPNTARFSTPVMGDEEPAPMPGEGSVTVAIDSFFAEFESTIDEEIEDTPTGKSRPKDKLIEQAVANLVRALTSKKEITEKDLEVLFDITKTKIVEATSAQAITIFFKEDDGIHFRHIAYSRTLQTPSFTEADMQRMTQILKDTVLPLEVGIVGRVIKENRSHITLDVQKDRGYFENVSKSTGFPVRSMITVPIAHEGTVYGAMQIINKNPASGETFFSRKDLRLAEEVADYSARVIYMARNPGIEWKPQDVARYVARLAKLEYVDLTEVEVDKKLLESIGEEPLRKFRILPLKKLGVNTLKAAMDNPLDMHRKDGFQLTTDLRIEVLVVSPGPQIDEAIEASFPRTAKTAAAKSEARNAFIAELDEKERAKQRESSRSKVELGNDVGENAAPIIKLVNDIILDAFQRGASDIHIEPFEDEVYVRYRSDGVITIVDTLPKRAIKSITARLKIMAGLDISEQRLPQDGRIHFVDWQKGGPDIDLRVATGPMVWGEKTVMRILDRTKAAVGIEQMGYSEHNLGLYMQAVEAPYGMLLHCGPTGSGKTTSLYASLSYCNQPDMNIQTAEDPVEYMLKGINQMQMKPEIGLNFARALKCYLRQDPDIILVGEIRDFETCSIAIEAALTGHQVFSTLHTNDAAGTITRMVEMGVEPFLITGAVLLICAQRLARKICQTCRQPYVPTDVERNDMLKAAPDEKLEIFVARKGGCPKCNNGYKGRIGIHEVLLMNDPVRTISSKHGVSAKEIQDVATKESALKTLFEDAMYKVRKGITDIPESLRNVIQS